jgi:hypothetical protein
MAHTRRPHLCRCPSGSVWVRPACLWHRWPRCRVWWGTTAYAFCHTTAYAFCWSVSCRPLRAGCISSKTVCGLTRRDAGAAAVVRGRDGRTRNAAEAASKITNLRHSWYDRSLRSASICWVRAWNTGQGLALTQSLTATGGTRAAQRWICDCSRTDAAGPIGHAARPQGGRRDRSAARATQDGSPSWSAPR